MPPVNEALSEKVSASRKLVDATREILRQIDEAARQAKRHIRSDHEVLGGKCPVAYLTPDSQQKILTEMCEGKLKASARLGRCAYAVFWDRLDASSTLMTILSDHVIVESWANGNRLSKPHVFKTAAQALTALA